MRQSLGFLGRSSLMAIATAGLLACVDPTSPPVSSTEQPIVGGAVETSTAFAAVGALTFYGSPFCTGTLIAPGWVLTASHCLLGDMGGGEEPSPSNTQFFVGNNAITQNGTYYGVAALYPHPQYNPSTTANDVALVALAETVSGVTPIAHNTSDVSGSLVGQDLRYVGFGTFSGYNADDSGIKRSATLEVIGLNLTKKEYYTESTATVGVCAGDSGGPGLQLVSGSTYRVVGVNSTVSGAGGEPCLNGQSRQMLVNEYAMWLGTTMGNPPNCNTTPGMCQCAGACQASGTCNNAVCQTLDCEAIYDCMGGCASSDQACIWGCYNLGTAAGRAGFDTLSTCGADHCASASDYTDCILANCLSEYQACFPPANCDVAGGDCPAGEACYPAIGGATDCFPSQERSRGQACDPDLATELACDDGLICINATGADQCHPMCTVAGDCAADEECFKPIFQGISTIGVCVCRDDDDDGACAADDCDDGDAGAHPGATEACDGHDDDCDGQVDEGCAACTDDDGDDFCVPDDCDDADPAVHPGAAERCGDGADDDCNGAADDGCEGCVDDDGDGYCVPGDCFDADPRVYPGAVEHCGDGYDDDCDGEADEGCDACIDGDADGFCDFDDCDDGDGAVNPWQFETCGNGLDDDCDGQVDETCTGGDGGDSGGWCVAAPPGGRSAPSGAPAAVALAVALVALRARRRSGR